MPSRSDPSLKPTIHAGSDEIACCILVRTLKSAILPLGVFVRDSLVTCYGEENWAHHAREAFSKKMQNYITPTCQLTDVYIVLELLMAELDQVFVQQAADLDGFESQALLLAQVAREIQGVAQTRTWLFHSFDVSAREVCDCLEKLSTLWRRFGMDSTAGAAFEEIQSSLLVRECHTSL